MLQFPIGFYIYLAEGGGGSLWTPDNLITEAATWYDYSDTASITDSGGAVSAVTDQTSNSKDSAQTTEADKPTTDATTQNSLNVIDLAEDFLVVDTTITGMKACLFVTGNLDGSSISNINPIHGTDTVSQHLYINVNTSDSADEVYITGSSGNAGHNGSGLSSGTTIDLGLTNAETEDWGVWYVDYDTAMEVDLLGRIIGGGGPFTAKMSMGEVLFLDYVPGVAERQRLEGYLGHKWNINLASGHPYENDAPLIPWTPTELTTEPTAWYDASELSTVTESGGEVSGWDDLTTNNNDLIQTTVGEKPRSGENTLGGLNTIDFTDDEMHTSADFTGIKACLFVTTNADEGICTLHASLTSDTDHTFLKAAGVDVDYDISIDGSNSNTGHAGHNGSSLTAGSNIDLGLTIAEVQGDGVWSMDYDSSINVGRIGRLTTSGDFDGDFSVGEIIFLDYIPSAADREKLEGYLAWKWNITLDSGHTYFSGAPTL